MVRQTFSPFVFSLALVFFTAGISDAGFGLFRRGCQPSRCVDSCRVVSACPQPVAVCCEPAVVQTPCESNQGCGACDGCGAVSGPMAAVPQSTHATEGVAPGAADGNSVTKPGFTQKALPPGSDPEQCLAQLDNDLRTAARLHSETPKLHALAIKAATIRFRHSMKLPIIVEAAPDHIRPKSSCDCNDTNYGCGAPGNDPSDEWYSCYYNCEMECYGR